MIRSLPEKENNIIEPTEKFKIEQTKKLEIEPTEKFEIEPTEKSKTKSTKKFNAGRYIAENTFKQLTLITKETFRVLNTGLSNNMGWGLLVIIFFLCNSAKAAPTDINNGITEANTTDLQSPIPELFSPLNEGMKTIIYGATTVVTKNYILKLGNAEKRVTDDISAVTHAKPLPLKMTFVKKTPPHSQWFISTKKIMGAQ